MAHKMPAAEVTINKELVNRLMAAQFPEFSHEAVHELANGWDNATFRLGTDMIVRLPRRAVALPLLRNEQKWLPVLASKLSIAVPKPIRIGIPQKEYPWPWSITPYFEGKTCLESKFENPTKEAIRLANFITSLHQEAPNEAPKSTGRGIPLSDRWPRFEQHVFAVKDQIDAPRLIHIFKELMAVEEWNKPAVWLHGDLHSLNIIVNQGEIKAIIDWGDLCSGDPATDLGSAWYLFQKEERKVMQSHLHYDDNTWLRGKGWALIYALVCLAYSADNPQVHLMGTNLLEAVLEDC